MQWLPRPAHWENYPIALAAFPFWLYLGNTLLLCAASVAGSLISCAPPAYAFARIPFRGPSVPFCNLGSAPPAPMLAKPAYSTQRVSLLLLRAAASC